MKSFLIFIPFIAFCFFILFLLRHGFCKKKIERLLFYFAFLISLFMMIAGSSVISDEYQRFETFASLEKEKKIIDLKKIDPMLAIDFKEFKDSKAFFEKIKVDEEIYLEICCFTYAFFLVILADIAFMLLHLIRRLYEKLFSKKSNS